MPGEGQLDCAGAHPIVGRKEVWFSAIQNPYLYFNMLSDPKSSSTRI